MKSTQKMTTNTDPSLVHSPVFVHLLNTVKWSEATKILRILRDSGQALTFNINTKSSRTPDQENSNVAACKQAVRQEAKN